MNKLILISFLIPLAGCATTPHEYCTKHASHYASYDQCYSEIQVSGKNRGLLSNVLINMGDSMQKGAHREEQKTQYYCHSDYAGGAVCQ